MQIIFYIFCFLLLGCNTSNKKECDFFEVRAFTHYNDNRKLDVYSKPLDGEILKNISSDEEAGHILQITDIDNLFFKVSFEDLELKDVWVKKGTLGLVTRNYDNQELNLYDSPNLDSSVSAILKGEQIVRVLDVCNKWAYVETIDEDDGAKRGWLQPDMQCGNPYTTCP